MSSDSVNRPNILLMMTDSSRCDTIGAYGSPFAISPNLDRLAAQGVRFDQAHTQAPVCMPARVSLLTGTHTPVHGCVENGISRRTGLATLPDLLAQNGYRCIMVGKTHFGGPVPVGFAEQHVLGGEKNASVDDEYGRHLAQYGYARATKHPNVVPENLFCDAYLVDQTIDALRRHVETNDDRPFFVLCSLPSPHAPLDPPGRWSRLFDDRELPPLNYVQGEEDAWPAHLRALVGPRGAAGGGVERADGTLDPSAADAQRRLYYGLAAYCDAQIGRLLDYLEASGLAASTMTVFTTDHGQQCYDHGFNDKHTFYDESWRIPLIMRWPGVVPAGHVADWAMTTDLTATFCHAAGVPAPYVQGFDLVTPLRDSTADRRTCAISVLHRSIGLATPSWKLEYFPEHGTGRLFDRRTDPREQHDLWADLAHRRIRDLLLTATLSWRADLTDVQYLQENTKRGGPVAQRVAAETAQRTGADAERRLCARIDELEQTPIAAPSRSWA